MTSMKHTVSGSGRILAVLFGLVALCVSVILSAFAQGSNAQMGLDTHTLKRTLVVKPDYRTGTLDATSVLTISNASRKPLRIIPVILYHQLEVTAANTSDSKCTGSA